MVHGIDLDEKGMERFRAIRRKWKLASRAGKTDCRREIEAEFGVSPCVANGWLLHGSPEAFREAKRKASAGRPSGRVAKAVNAPYQETLAGATVRPAGTSAARWRIEKRRRAMVRRLGPYAMELLPDPDTI